MAETDVDLAMLEWSLVIEEKKGSINALLLYPFGNGDHTSTSGCFVKAWCIDIYHSTPGFGVFGDPGGDGFSLRYGTISYFNIGLTSRCANKLIEKSASRTCWSFLSTLTALLPDPEGPTTLHDMVRRLLPPRGETHRITMSLLWKVTGGLGRNREDAGGVDLMIAIARSCMIFKPGTPGPLSACCFAPFLIMGAQQWRSSFKRPR